ncbi:hypothetical protein JCGZ_02604 [Jatropha curcas]|uniref:RING-type E3 ubiquitin transferase n=1 Tax=Jatropha curcas TaxID=180498 RepID=A0A067L665_JATCU|nr:hypothetical protein JCGZ_02604 [Jatropha curcas]
MGSVGNQNPWSPYDTAYRDCSQGICSIYCPQWCYIIFPPPPPFTLGDDDSGTDFSPLIIAVIGILASAFILVSYYTIISKYCRRRGSHPENTMELDGNRDQISSEAWQSINGGLDESIIKSITVCKYKKVVLFAVPISLLQIFYHRRKLKKLLLRQLALLLRLPMNINI